MGEVWQVFHLALGRPQVLKLILPGHAIQPERSSGSAAKPRSWPPWITTTS